MPFFDLGWRKDGEDKNDSGRRAIVIDRNKFICWADIVSRKRVKTTGQKEVLRNSQGTYFISRPLSMTPAALRLQAKNLETRLTENR